MDEKQYRIPVIVRKYGYIYEKGTDMADALSKAKERLNKMMPTELDAIACYQDMAAEIDTDGII